MVLHVLIDDATADISEATAEANPLNAQNFNTFEYGIFQADIPGSGTVVLKGRTSPDMPWVDITTFTGPNGQRVTLFPQMIATLSGHSGGAVRAELAE